MSPNDPREESPSLDLLYSDIEEALRDAVRDLLTDHCEPTAVTDLYDGDRSVVAGLWSRLAGELGLAGLLVPEERGGAGATAREAAVVLEELGRAVAPVPFLTSAVIATLVLREAHGNLLESLASGGTTAALAVPWSTAPHAPIPALTAKNDHRVSGTVRSVAGALEADHLLVPVDTGAGLGVYVVRTADVEVTPVVSLDMSRQLADLRLDQVLAEPVLDDAEAAVRGALAAGAALLASEQLGLAQWCLDSTVDYVKQRRQFGRAVGGFQAVKHRIADLYTAVESGRAAARNAVATLAADDPDAPVATAVAQAFCSELAVTAAEETIQLHGGIGMTWEHPAHLYLKRAKSDQIALGTSGSHRAALAHLVDLPGPLDPAGGFR
ncbi:acyl-CoA dehydrogenase [Streptomyces phaeolivaceus]|uniref:Acyl-CoA dehydrogenase n=1 Tax=Streptomyces phaeolivaceus TaxID=2653200 RepID=A0A5P8KGI5_9ACTN|nr:acyl-CoA dehydrogenase family protein [Streptomyces phaeolivaceus]QFR01650.1 acyl-CoA dehydrogenase [Streptomyces phaeolivaceus]